jgi:hypothetical protein
MLTIQFEQTIVREGWPASFRLATERAWLRMGVEVDRYLATLTAGTKVQSVTFSWTEIAHHPTHAVWAARTDVVLEARQGTA